MSQISTHVIRFVLICLVLSGSLSPSALLAQSASATGANTVAEQLFLPVVTAGSAQVTPLVSSASTQCIQFPLGQGPEEVCVSGFFPEDPITVQLGQSFPLATVEIQNNTDRAMSFRLDWVGLLPAWGAPPLYFVTLEPQTSTSVPGLVLEAHDGLGLGSNLVALGWSAVGGSYEASVQQNFELIALPPQELAETIVVPVRMCVLENSPLAKDNPPGSFVQGLELAQLLQRATVPWMEQANIMYRPALARHGIPVIGDPEKEYLTGLEQVGDIDVALKVESESAKAACEAAWAQSYPTQRGLIVTSARELVDDGARAQARGVAPGPADAFLVRQDSLITGQRDDDLCGDPRALTVDDVTDQFVIIIDPLASEPFTDRDENREVVLAHELGHTVLLDHGNGLDDNGDGLQPGDQGPRRFDAACDPLGVDNLSLRPQEDINAGVPDDGLMSPFVSPDSTLRPLQVEQARAVAKLYPGALFLEGVDLAGVDPAGAVVRTQPLCAEPGSPCTLPRTLSLMRAQVATAPQTGLTTLSHTFFGPLSPDLSARYASFVDVDDNPSTGCAPAALGFPTSQGGVELVSEVALAPGNVLPSATGRLWSCRSGGWQAESAGRVIAYGQREAESGDPLFGIVSLQLDPALLQGSTRVRMQAVAIGEAGAVDRLPNADPASSATLDLVPGPLLQCEAARPILPPGGKSLLAAGGFAPGAELAVLVRGEEVARTHADGAGDFSAEIAIPADAPAGTAPITVIDVMGADNAACAVVIAGSAVTPSTRASTTPEPSPAGWHNAAVTVRLDATSVGPEVAEIRFSALGAEPIAPTTVPGSSATANLSAKGITTLSFFAVDTDGVVEAPRRLDIRIDTEAPAIAGSVDPAPNANGWHNRDVTVRFACSDALSGLWFCSPPVVLDQEGAGQAVTGEAMDLAANQNSAVVGGIHIDKTPPVITYAGNTTPYGLLESVQITCSASDALSGLATDTCADITGPAYTFAPGENSFSAQATDNADNTTSVSTSFEVIPTYNELCTLTGQFAAATTPDPHQAEQLGRSMCSKLADAERFEAAGKLAQKETKIADYLSQLAANTPNFFTEQQAETLAQWAAAL